MKRSVIKAAGITALVVPLLSGCYIGKDAATQTQRNSGNGTSVVVPGMTIDNATIVAGNPESGKGAFLGTLYNTTDQPDALIAISTDGGEAKLLPDPVPVPAMAAVAISSTSEAKADFQGLTERPGQYAPLTLTFRNAGEAEFSSLVVPPYGYYLEAAPEGTEEIEKVIVVEEGESKVESEGEAEEAVAVEVEEVEEPAAE